MGIVIVDGHEVEVGPQERINCIQAAARGHRHSLLLLASGAERRRKLPDVSGRTGAKHPDTGAITMVPKLVPACQTPAKEGTVVVTNSKAVIENRARVEESLLLDHPIDCPICDKAGECLLQDYHFNHGQPQRRPDIRPFTSRRRELGPTVTLFVDRCVMCSRCVRFTREITGTRELFVTNRGSHEEIDVFPGHPLDNKMSGNVVDLCPVGALGDKDFLYKQRVWFMNNRPGVCAGCSTGCSIEICQNQDTVYRLKPRENVFVNKYWMCDEGRYGYHHVHRADRLVEPRRRDGEKFVNVDWSALPQELDARLKKAGRLAVVISPHLTVEEAYLLAQLARKYDPQAVLALGPVPVVGKDEKFASGFTIHAEKCPNRKGVKAVLNKFSERLIAFDDLLTELDGGTIRAAWVAGGYPQPWIDEATAERFGKLDLLIVQDMFDSPLWQRATFQLPGASFAERAGSYVNYNDRLQSFDWAIRPPAGVWIDGHLYWRLLGRKGMYNPRSVLSEVAAEIIYFAAAGGEISPVGVDLKVNLLAGGNGAATAGAASDSVTPEVCGTGTPQFAVNPLNFSMLTSAVIIAVIKIVLLLGGLMTAAAYLVLMERWIAAWVQDRQGPNRVGIPLTKIRIFGLGQPLADGLKFIFKEDYTPAQVDKGLFTLAPIVILTAALAIFAAIPFGSVLPQIDIGGLSKPIELIVAPRLDVGLVYVFALSSIAVYGVILGGWASNNKYSFLGGLRSSAQLIAYEIPLGLGILGVVLFSGSLRLDKIITDQAVSGVWNIALQPLGLLVFTVASFAEAARLPFDLPEAEQELVGGYHTEYAGMRLLLFLIAEFLHMVTAAFLIVILYFGGWHLWGLTGSSDIVTWPQAILRIVVLDAKVLAVILFFMIVRWSWPRFRFDQLMSMAWKVMLPLGVVNLVLMAVLSEYRRSLGNNLLTVAIVSWVVSIMACVVAGMTAPLSVDNRPTPHATSWESES